MKAMLALLGKKCTRTGDALRGSLCERSPWRNGGDYVHARRSYSCLATGKKVYDFGKPSWFSRRLVTSEKTLYSTETSSGGNKTHYGSSRPTPFPSDLGGNVMREHDPHDQTKHAFRPAIDPSKTSILLFPGQGSQYVGMASNFIAYPRVRELYEHASHIYNFDLLNLSLHGPKDKLDRTYYSQPAIFLASLAALSKMEEEYPMGVENCVGVAGLSVGEYAALVFAEVLSFEDALRAIKVRAEAMQEASEAVESGLMTVLLSPKSRLKFGMLAAREYCKEEKGIVEPVCSISTYLTTEIRVVGGNMEALDFLHTNSKELGIRCKGLLPVSGAFHTELMKPATVNFRLLLQKLNLGKPTVPVHSNVDGKPHWSPPVIRNHLTKQLWKPVRWEQIIHTLYSRRKGVEFPKTYEVGPQRQLGTLLSKANATAYQHYTHMDTLDQNSSKKLGHDT